MKIERLFLKGMLRFGAPISLDLRDLPPGLIAIVGENGAGKSTLLEAMIAGFYREFPSRGQAIDYATEKDSYIQVVASFDDGRQLDGRVNMDGVQRNSDAVLRDGPGAFLNDGKVTTFDAAVAKHLPPLSQLLASSFSAQNRRGTFSQLDKKGRRDLFASLLGLAQFEAHAATSRQAGLMVERRIAELRALVDRFAADTTETQQTRLDQERRTLDETIAFSTQELQTARRAVSDLETKRTAVASEAATYTAAVTARDAARLREQALRDALRAIETESVTFDRRMDRRRQDIAAALDRVLAAEQARIDSLPSADAVAAELAKAIARIDQQLAADRDERETRIANNETLRDRAERIRNAVRETESLRAEHAATTDRHKAATARRTAKADAMNTVAIDRAALSTSSRDLEAARTSAGLLTRVPFGEKCADAGCEFVKTASTAKGLIPALEAQETRWRELGAELATLAGEVDTIDTEIASIDRVASDLSTKIAALQPVAALLERLNAAETRVTELRAEIATLELRAESARMDAHQAALDTTIAADRQQVASMEAIEAAKRTEAEALDAIVIERSNTEADFTARRTPIETELATVAERIVTADADVTRTAPAHDALATLDVQLQDARGRVTGEQITLSRLEAESTALARRRSEFDTRAQERDRLAGAVKTLEQDLVEWQALARIFGPEGLPVLEIDAAGPGVSALANDLLHACFGSRFTVELVTQEAKASGKGLKEVFELKVFDGERGGEARDLTDLSGGEQVLVDEALKSAIALFVNQRNVFPIRTCWRDETTGALDPENALRYIAMLRRVHERAGLHHLFFVSHNPEAAALADAQIVVAGGTARIVMAPFGRVEAA